MLRILVRGSNDVGSAVAHYLFSAGYAVVIHDIPLPTATRRKMAFTDAIFNGQAELAGVRAVRVDDPMALTTAAARRDSVVVTTADYAHCLAAYQPDVLIDGRMRKRATPEIQRGLARLTIGLGPGFVAGETVDLAVETSWAALGQVVTAGPTLPLAGEPQPIDGVARERYVYAPVEGMFRTLLDVGDMVEPGETVARIGEVALLAPIGGVLRGLTHDGVPVTGKTKVIEVDPRGRAGVFLGIGERPARIAEGVLAAVSAVDWP